MREKGRENCVYVGLKTQSLQCHKVQNFIMDFMMPACSTVKLQSVSLLTYFGKRPDHDGGECPDGAERPGHWWSNSCLVWLSRLLHGCIYEYKSLVILYIATLYEIIQAKLMDLYTSSEES